MSELPQPPAEIEQSPEMTLAESMQARLDGVLVDGNLPSFDNGDFDAAAAERSRITESRDEQGNIAYAGPNGEAIDRRVVEQHDKYFDPNTWVLDKDAQETFIRFTQLTTPDRVNHLSSEDRARLQKVLPGGVTKEGLDHLNDFSMQRLALSAAASAALGKDKAGQSAPTKEEEALGGSSEAKTAVVARAAEAEPKAGKPDRRNGPRGTAAGEGKRKRAEAQAQAEQDGRHRKTDDGEDGAATQAADTGNAPKHAKPEAKTDGAPANDNRKLARGKRGGAKNTAEADSQTAPATPVADKATPQRDQKNGAKVPMKQQIRLHERTRGVLQDDVRDRLEQHREGHTTKLVPGTLRRRSELKAAAAAAAAGEAVDNDAAEAQGNPPVSPQEAAELIKPTGKRERVRRAHEAEQQHDDLDAAEQALLEEERERRDANQESLRQRMRRLLGRRAVAGASKSDQAEDDGQEGGRHRRRDEAEYDSDHEDEDERERMSGRKKLALVAGAVVMATVAAVLISKGVPAPTGGGGSSVASAAPTLGPKAPELPSTVYDAPVRPGQRLWTYLQEAGVPVDQIMNKLSSAADKYSQATGNRFAWHGNSMHRWIEVYDNNGKSISDTKGVLQTLKSYL